MTYSSEQRYAALENIGKCVSAYRSCWIKKHSVILLYFYYFRIPLREKPGLIAATEAVESGNAAAAAVTTSSSLSTVALQMSLPTVQTLRSQVLALPIIVPGTNNFLVSLLSNVYCLNHYAINSNATFLARVCWTRASSGRNRSIN